jgi:hypothetical protein
MSQSNFEKLLYTIRDVAFPAYEEGEQLPDGRTTLGNDPLRTIGRFADQLVHMWQELFVPGTVVVADETMVNSGNGRVPDGLGRQCSVPVEGAGLCLAARCRARCRPVPNRHMGAKRALDELMRSKRNREVNKLPRENMKW